MKNRFRLFACAGWLSLAACQTLPPPTADLADAKLRIEQAAAAEAETHAPVELQFARDKLARAEALSLDKDYTGAARLVAEARADADLAQARARAAKLRNEVARQSRDNDSLRAELLGGEAP